MVLVILGSCKQESFSIFLKVPNSFFIKKNKVSIDGVDSKKHRDRKHKRKHHKSKSRDDENSGSSGSKESP